VRRSVPPLCGVVQTDDPRPRVSVVQIETVHTGSGASDR
jgi:hypothetical protein